MGIIERIGLLNGGINPGVKPFEITIHLNDTTGKYLVFFNSYGGPDALIEHQASLRWPIPHCPNLTLLVEGEDLALYQPMVTLNHQPSTMNYLMELPRRLMLNDTLYIKGKVVGNNSFSVCFRGHIGSERQFVDQTIEHRYTILVLTFTLEGTNAGGVEAAGKITTTIYDHVLKYGDEFSLIVEFNGDVEVARDGVRVESGHVGVRSNGSGFQLVKCSGLNSAFG